LTLVLCSPACMSLALAQLPSPPETKAQPPDVRLQLQTDSGKTKFQIGEMIPLKLSFTSSSHQKYQINMATYDRSGRMNYEAFLVEPGAGWSDPLRAYFAYGGYIGGGGTTFRFLSSEPTVLPLVLNEWVRFDRPGKYSVSVVSHRITDVAKDAPYPQTTTDLISNRLELTIVPASATWQNATLKQAVAALDSTRASDSAPRPAAGEIKDTQTALTVLRHLGTPGAAKELAQRLRGDNSTTDYYCMFGLVGSPAHEAALAEMHRLVDSPDHPVSSTFLYCLRVLMRNPDQTLEKLADDEKRNADTIRSQMLEAVRRKRGTALATTLYAVLRTASLEEGRLAPLGEQFAAQLAGVFDLLPVEAQGQILGYNWDSIKSRAFLPLLRKYAEQYKEFRIPNEVNAYNSQQVSASALQRWYELEPSEARPVIIHEILRPTPRYSARVLGILADKTLPEVEQALAEHFAAEQDSYAAENLASLLHRYASDSVLSEVLPVVDRHVGKWACAIQAPILAYLLHVNPEIARPRIEAAMAARGDGYSACNHSLLGELGALEPSPLLQEFALSALDDNDPEVAGNAAGYLGRYGSPDTEERLWDHLVRWNERWSGKEEELRYLPGETNPNLWQRNLGESLIRALASSKSWLADSTRLHQLRQLSVGAQMRQQVDSMLAGWDRKPWTISHYRSFNQHHFQVLQYETDSLESIKQKLAQFPPGSDFTWRGEAPESVEEQSIARDLAEFLARHEMKLTMSAK
jgi:hypothetical protein